MGRTRRFWFSCIYLAIVSFGYFLTGLSGLHNERIIITNFFSFCLLTDPYHLLHFLACNKASFPCKVADIRGFNHVSAEYMVPLSVVVLWLGLIGFVSTIAAGAKLKGGYYALCVLAILATGAAVFDVIWVLANMSLSGFSLFFTAIPSFWAFTYWVAVHHLRPRLNQSPALA